MVLVLSYMRWIRAGYLTNQVIRIGDFLNHVKQIYPGVQARIKLKFGHQIVVLLFQQKAKLSLAYAYQFCFHNNLGSLIPLPENQTGGSNQEASFNQGL